MKGDLIVDETKKTIIRGISDELIRTIGIVTIPIEIKNNEFIISFHVVNSKVPLIKHGIIGHSFLRDNKAVIDIANNTLIIDQPNTNSVIKNCYILNARSETIISIPIANKFAENKNVLIEKQELIKDVYCGETISSVKNGNIIISVMNIAEHDKEINNEHIKK